MAAFLDICRFVPTLGGTTDWTYSAAVTGYQSPTAAGAVNGTVYRYRAESSPTPSQWEIGYGAYNSSTGTFSRTTVLYNSSGGTSKINFTVAPQVAIVALKEDLISVEEANSFTATQQSQARANIASCGRIKLTVFKTSGTWTPDANLLYAEIECVGGGGSSGGVAGAGTNIGLSSGAGSGAEYSFKVVTAAVASSSQTVTIGSGGTAPAAGNNAGNSGGTTSVGTLCTAFPGAGGQPTSGVSGVGGGAVGGTGGASDFSIPGGDGGGGFGSSNYTTAQAFYTADGGSSHMSGTAVTGSGASVGTAGKNYGGGASGSTTIDATSRAGAAGANGIAIIKEYCSA